LKDPVLAKFGFVGNDGLTTFSLTNDELVAHLTRHSTDKDIVIHYHDIAPFLLY
jgi:hypothetical protein